MRAANGNSTITAEATLSHTSGVPASSRTSNQASQHNSVPVMIRNTMTIWRPRQNAQPVEAKAASRMMSNPTHARRQCWAWNERFSVRRRTMIQPMSTVQAIIDARTPRRRPRVREIPSKGCG